MPDDFDLTPMCWVRAAILNAHVEGLTVLDLMAMAENAKTPQSFDNAVNELIRTGHGVPHD